MEKGYVYYKKALEKGLSLSIDVYHGILKATPSIRQGVVQKWEFIDVSFHFLCLYAYYFLIISIVKL